MTKICRLTCEYRVNPLGIDVIQPRLNWQMKSERRGARQTAYQILTAASEEELLNSEATLWNSGKIETDQSIHVPYQGPPLHSGQRVFWKVRVWDEMGQMTESPCAWWEMGLLDRSDWQGTWIGAPFWGGPRTSSPAPFLRNEFSLQKPVASARLYATAVGLYECYLNGVRVGNDLLTPGWTDYSRRIQYQTYDVTHLLRDGVNTLGAILGDGWGVGNIAWLGRQHYADRPRFLAQLVVVYTDGSRDVFSTNENWKVSQGPILEADFLMGESYDARRELPGWSEPSCDTSRWWPVVTFADEGAALIATNCPTVMRQETIQPVSIQKIPGLKPRWVFDFGQNLVGWVRLSVQGEKGSTIILRHAEALNPDGTLYTANLRTARSTDHYTLKGEGKEIWEPRFTFHGFRYVEAAGLADIPTQETVNAVVIHSDIPETGTFSCSDPLINQLQHNIVWSQKGNFVDIPSDCPQRDERLGWTGDAQVFIRTAAFNRDVAGFFTRWTRDLDDAQYPNGAYPSVAPNLEKWTIGEGGPAWADAGVICPWTIYQCYGDKRLLEERYPAMRRFIEFLARTSRDGLRCYPDYAGWHGNGDWLALDGSDGREGGTSKELIGTAFFAYSATILGNIAHILGREEDANIFRSYAAEARAAFLKSYVREDGTIVGDTQTSYVLALEFDLLPEELRPLAAAQLARGIRDRNDHLSTGFIGTPYINDVLTRSGYLDTAYALLKQTTWPSWLYPVTQGATTIWERWDGWTHDKGFQDPKMNSFNHYAYGAIGAWMYTTIAGIDIDPNRPAYKNVVMHPQLGGGLEWANAEFHSMYGTIRSTWKIEDSLFKWQISIPTNTTATLYFPTSEKRRILESGQPLGEVNEITVLGIAKDSLIISIPSGEYDFKVILR